MRWDPNFIDLKKVRWGSSYILHVTLQLQLLLSQT